jgi:hypothetical protein
MLCRKANDVLRENYGVLPDDIKKEKADEEYDAENYLIYNDLPDISEFSQVFVNNFPEIIEKPEGNVKKVKKDVDALLENSVKQDYDDDDEDVVEAVDDKVVTKHEEIDDSEDEPLSKRTIAKEAKNESRRKKRRHRRESGTSSRSTKPRESLSKRSIAKRRREMEKMNEALKADPEDPDIDNLTPYDVDEFVRTWEKGDYICFFCDEFFPSYIKFRDHRNTKHAFNDMGLAKVRRNCIFCYVETDGYIKHLAVSNMLYKYYVKIDSKVSKNIVWMITNNFKFT